MSYSETAKVLINITTDKCYENKEWQWGYREIDSMGGDWSQDRLVPDLVAALVNAKKPLIRFPQAIRPWQHVLGPLSGYLMLAEKLYDFPTDYAQAWNFGPEDKDCQPVSEIAHQFCKIWGDAATWEKEPSTIECPHEATFLKLDSSKAKSLLQWQPRWTLQQAIEITAAWYKGWCRGEDPLDMTLQQIELYTRG
ncbi:MAG: hypothetical protein ACD_60C00135G0003 [uncultured bacterium]|nr:MAG: hypothetical protein ACD_60C00135G0003 [uncultured bacterium]